MSNLPKGLKMGPSGMVSIPIDIFRHAGRDIPFDIYLKVSEENWVHVFSKTSGLDYRRLAQYIKKGVTEFFIRAEDQSAFEQFLARRPEVVFVDPQVPKEKKIALLLNLTEQSVAELFTAVHVDEQAAASTQKVVKNYVDLLTSSPESLAMILRLVSHGDYLYYHSVAVSILSLFLAKATGSFSTATLEMIGLGGFLHDVGCTQLPDSLVNSARPLTEEEWDLMRTHPKLGLQILDENKLVPDEVRYIVYQHHEQPGGKGYPNRMSGSGIYFPAKIVAIADSFSALISKRPFRAAHTVEGALNLMKSENGKFDPELLRLMGSIFLKE